jgi:hypothetical protein
MAVTAKMEYFVKNMSFWDAVLGQFSTAFGLSGVNLRDWIFKLLRSPRIDSKNQLRQAVYPGGPIRQPYS